VDDLILIWYTGRCHAYILQAGRLCAFEVPSETLSFDQRPSVAFMRLRW
jgi:hypothetical protein